MASSRPTGTVTWSSGSQNKTVSANTIQWSDAYAVNAEVWEMDVSVNANNQGTPASGDTCDVYIAYSVDGTNFDTDEHSQFLGRLDTYGTNTPGENPARATYPVRTACQKFKVGVICAQAATRNIVVSAAVAEHRPQ